MLQVSTESQRDMIERLKQGLEVLVGLEAPKKIRDPKGKNGWVLLARSAERPPLQVQNDLCPRAGSGQN